MKEGIFKQERDKLITLKKDVIGVVRLWEVAFESQDREVREQAGKFLISIYTVLGRSFTESIFELAQSFAYYALSFAEKDAKNKDGAMDAIRLIKAYIKE